MRPGKRQHFVRQMELPGPGQKAREANPVDKFVTRVPVVDGLIIVAVGSVMFGYAIIPWIGRIVLSPGGHEHVARIQVNVGRIRAGRE